MQLAVRVRLRLLEVVSLQLTTAQRLPVFEEGSYAIGIVQNRVAEPSPPHISSLSFVYLLLVAGPHCLSS